MASCEQLCTLICMLVIRAGVSLQISPGVTPAQVSLMFHDHKTIPGSTRMGNLTFPIKRILYLNMEQCTNRRQHMEEMLSVDSHNVSFERVSAVHLAENLTDFVGQPADVQRFTQAKAVVPKDLRRRQFHISSYAPFEGKFGSSAKTWNIYFSHMRVMERVVALAESGAAGPNDAVLVLEDDAALKENWLADYNMYSTTLPDDWAVMKLYCQYPFKRLFSTMAYVVRVGAAADILHKLETAHRWPINDVDFVLGTRTKTRCISKSVAVSTGTACNSGA